MRVCRPSCPATPGRPVLVTIARVPLASPIAGPSSRLPAYQEAVPTTGDRIRSGDLRLPACWLLVATFALSPLQVLRIGPHVTLADVALLAAGTLALVSCHHRRPVESAVGGWLPLGLALMAVGGFVGLLFARPQITSPMDIQGQGALSDFTRDNFSVVTAGSGALLLRLIGVVLICLIAVVGSEPSSRALKWCLGTYVGASSFSAALGIMASLPVLGSLPLEDLQNGVGRAVGLAGGANTFGVVTVIGAVLAASIATWTTDVRVRLLLTGALVVQLLGLAYSGSRGALVGAAIGLALVAVRLVRTGRARPVLVGLGLCVVFLVVAVIGLVRVPTVDRLLLRTDTPASARSVESTDVRIELLGRAIDDRGLDSLLVGSGLREQPATSVHNGHFEVWLGMGALGLIGWLVICIVTCLPAFRLSWTRESFDQRQEIRFAVSAAFVAFAVTALTVNNVWNRYLWLLVALVAFLKSDRSPGSRFPPVAARRRLMVTLLMTASFGLMPLFGVRFTKVVSVADLPLALAVGLALLWGPFGRPPGQLVPPLLRWGAALVVVGSATGLLFATTPFESAVLHGRLVATMVVCWMVVAWWDPTWREVRRLLQAFIFGAAVSAGLGAFSSITKIGVADPWRDQVERATGLAGNANHLGVFCAIGLALACVLATQERRWVLYGAAVVPLLAGLLWTGSRSGVVALVVALVFLAVHLVRMGMGRSVGAAAATLLLLFLLGFAGLVRVPVIDRALLRTDTVASSFAVLSTDTRLSLAEERLQDAGTASLLVGDGMVNRSTTGPHSGHLEIWIGLGLVGFAGWVLVCLSMIRPVFGLTWSRRRLMGRELVLYAVTLAFAAHIVLASFLEHIWTRYIWLLVALAAVLGSPGNEPDDDGAGDGDRTRVIRLET